MFYIVHTDTFQSNFLTDLHFLDDPSWRRGPWMSVKRRVEACIFLNHLVCWIVAGTCTRLKERGYLLLLFRDYILSHVLVAILQILRGRSHRLQSNQLKTRQNIFCAWARDWTQDLSVLTLRPCHLSHHNSAKATDLNLSSLKTTVFLFHELIILQFFPRFFGKIF